MNQESLVPNNDKETTSEATNTSNRIAPAENIITSKDSGGDITLAMIQKQCESDCFRDSNKQKCYDDCVAKLKKELLAKE